MNKQIGLFLVIFFFFACSSKQKEILDGVERIPIQTDIPASDITSFVDKIEIVPLETTDSSLVNGYYKILYDDTMNLYLIYNREQVVMAFTGDGKFVGSSKSMRGNGPQEYNMVLDVNFNPFLEGIDLLNPYGTIYTYTPTFEKLIAKRTVRPEFFYNSLLALNENEYLFTIPAFWVGEEICHTNMASNKETILPYSGTISAAISMQKRSFYKKSNAIYFIPNELNYYIYQFDEAGMNLVPTIFLDFANETINIDDLPGNATGKRTGKSKDSGQDIKRERANNGINERRQYILSTNYMIPYIKLLNENFIYVYIDTGKGGLGMHYIYDRKDKRKFLLKNKESFYFRPCFDLTEDNILLTISEPFYIKENVNTQLMSTKDMERMEQLKEDDNPVILKYYLKK